MVSLNSLVPLKLIRSLGQDRHILHLGEYFSVHLLSVRTFNINIHYSNTIYPTEMKFRACVSVSDGLKMFISILKIIS